MKNNADLTGMSRSSNIELLKVIAIFLIIVSHFTQTLGGADSENTLSSAYVVDLTAATAELSRLTLSFFRYFGSVGNSIFFVCSAWFLIDRSKTNNKKVLHMLLDVWLVSVLILCGVYVCGRDLSIPASLIVKCLLPTTFSNNWYITAYILIYLLYPGLNKLLGALSQRTHLSAVLISLTLSSVYIPVFREWGAYLYINRLVMWVIIYFAVAYMKWYMPSFANSMKRNILLFVFSLAGIIGGILLFNYLGLLYEFFDGRLTNFNNPQNLFIFLLSVSLLNIFRQFHFQSSFVNSVSRLTLLIYVIHENILLRTYFRPLLFSRLYDAFGYDHLICRLLLFSLLTFIASFVLAFLYSKTFQKVTRQLSDALDPIIVRKWNRLLDRLIDRCAVSPASCPGLRQIALRHFR